MRFFSRAPVACPLCAEALPPEGRRSEHWETHVETAGSGRAAGRHLWHCECGLSDGYWTDVASAATALTLHMARKHRIAM